MPVNEFNFKCIPSNRMLCGRFVFQHDKSINTKCIPMSVMEEENKEPDSYADVVIRGIAMKSKELLLIYKV